MYSYTIGLEEFKCMQSMKRPQLNLVFLNYRALNFFFLIFLYFHSLPKSENVNKQFHYSQ